MALHISFRGDATSLYLFNPSTGSWVDVSRAVGGPYRLAEGEHWTFQVSGASILAMQKNDPPQIFTFGVSERFEDVVLH